MPIRYANTLKNMSVRYILNAYALDLFFMITIIAFGIIVP